MNVRNPEKYWDEGNKNLYRWHQKGFWKRYFRKKFYRKLRNNEI